MASDRDLRIQVLLAAMDKASGPIKAIREESRKAGAAIRGTRADIVKLEKAQADLKGFRDMKRGLQETGLKLDEAQRKTARLAREIDQTDRPTAKLTRDFERAKREAAELGREFERGQRTLQDTRDRLRDAGVSTRNLVEDERRLTRELRSSNEQLDRQKRHFAELKRTEGQRIREARAGARVDEDMARQNGATAVFLGRAGLAAGAFAGYGALRAARQSVEDAAVYEHTLTSIGQKLDFSRDQAERLGGTFRRLGPELARTAQQTAEGADAIAGIGILDQFDSIKDREERFRAIQSAMTSVMTTAGRARTAYGAEEADTVRAVAAGYRNLNIALKDARYMGDMMAAGGNAGSFEYPAMARELPALTGLMAELHQTGPKAFANLVSALEVSMSNAGSDSEAANNIRGLLIKMLAPDTRKKFDKYGINLSKELEKAAKDGRDIFEVITLITRQAMKKGATVGDLFGEQQSQMAILALNSEFEKHLKLRKQILDSQGTLDKQFDQRMGDTAAKWDRLQSLLDNLKLQVGKSFSPATNFILDGATSVAERASAHLESYGFLNTLGAMVGGNLMPQAAVDALKKQREAGDKSIAESKRVNQEIGKTLGNTSESKMWGRNMMLGLQSGMLAAAPGVLAAVYAVSGKVKAAFRGDMQIKSPSRVFMGYGRYIAQGLALGIDDGGRDALASIRRVSQSITYHPSATALARKAGGAAGPGGGAASVAITGPITITIAQQPGQDGAALARQIQAALASEARAAQARRASSYEDMD